MRARNPELAGGGRDVAAGPLERVAVSSAFERREIDTRRAHRAAAAMAVALAGLAGAFLAMRALISPYAGPAQLLFAFEAVVIGGIGSLWGTLVGGIILGTSQSLGVLISPQGFQLAGHSVFLAVLAARLCAAHAHHHGGWPPCGLRRRGLAALPESRSDDVMTDARPNVERWTPESRMTVRLAALAFIVLALLPFLAGGLIIDKLTTLLVSTSCWRSCGTCSPAMPGWCRSASRRFSD